MKSINILSASLIVCLLSVSGLTLSDLRAEETNAIAASAFFKSTSTKSAFAAFTQEVHRFTIKGDGDSGFLISYIDEDQRQGGFLPFVTIFDFIDLGGARFLDTIGFVDLENISELKILEEDRRYMDRPPGKQIYTRKPYFKASMTLKDDKNYIVYMRAFDLIDGPLKFKSGAVLIDKNVTIHRVAQGMTVRAGSGSFFQRIKNMLK